MSTVVSIEPHRARMTKIAERFPSLARLSPQDRAAAGVAPFDAERLARWAKSGKSHGEVVTVRFLLGIWGADNPTVFREVWGLETFDLVEARGVWDADHVRAFALFVEHDWNFWP